MDADYEEVLEVLALAIWSRAYDDMKHGNCTAATKSSRVQQIVDKIVGDAANATKDDS